MVSESGFISEDPGFDPLAGQGAGQVFLSLKSQRLSGSVKYVCSRADLEGDKTESALVGVSQISPHKS